MIWFTPQYVLAKNQPADVLENRQPSHSFISVLTNWECKICIPQFEEVLVEDALKIDI